MNEERITMTDEKASEALESGYEKAEEILKDKDEVERLLQRLEKKLEKVPYIGTQLSVVPVLASLLKSYIQGEYKDVPIGTIIAIISALVYFVSPIDILPDSIPIVGYFDDAVVVAACWKLVDSDVKEYKAWRTKNGKEEELDI